MNFLGCTPGGAPPISAKIINDKTDVFKVSYPCVRVPEPKAFRACLHHRGRAFDQRGGSRRRQFVQFIRRGCHGDELRRVVAWRDPRSHAVVQVGLRIPVRQCVVGPAELTGDVLVATFFGERMRFPQQGFARQGGTGWSVWVRAILAGSDCLHPRQSG